MSNVHSIRRVLTLGCAGQIVVHMVENALRLNQPMGVDVMHDILFRYNAVVEKADEIANSFCDLKSEVVSIWSEAAPPFRTADSMPKLE